MDVENHVRIIPKIRAGSNELVELFQRFGKGEIPLANDTSFGVGYYPYSSNEKEVLDLETLLNDKNTKEKFPFIGEDIKVMGVQNFQKNEFTVAVAMVDKFISSIADYARKINTIKEFINSHLAYVDALNIKLKNYIDKEQIANFALDRLNELPYFWKKIINK